METEQDNIYELDIKCVDVKDLSTAKEAVDLIITQVSMAYMISLF